VTKAKDIVKRVKQIAPLSQSAMKLMDVIKREEYSLGEITKIVEYDPALTANVLKVVNAPAFGLGQPVNSLARAVAFLGDKTVIGIAIASCAPQVYNKSLDGYQAESGELWRHSLHTAIAAREVVKHAKQAINIESAFTGGILHDIGKAVLNEYLQGQAETLLASVEAKEAADFSDAERKLLGLDHSEVGLALATHWNLPALLRQCIRFHHTPAEAEEGLRGLVYAVHLGDAIAMMGGSGTGADALLYPIDEGWSAYFNLDEIALEQLIINVNIEFQRTKTSFNN
jgi:putative nucleotidyltransferase with HDIG domain